MDNITLFRDAPGRKGLAATACRPTGKSSPRHGPPRPYFRVPQSGSWQDRHRYCVSCQHPGDGPERPHAVYYVKPSGEVLLVTDNLESPNGILLSRDEKTLYVVDSRSEYVLAFDVKPDGTLGSRRNFVKLKGIGKNEQGAIDSGIDGLALDSQGDLYAISHDGVEVFNLKGIRSESFLWAPRPPTSHSQARMGRRYTSLLMQVCSKCACWPSGIGGGPSSRPLRTLARR